MESYNMIILSLLQLFFGAIGLDYLYLSEWGMTLVMIALLAIQSPITYTISGIIMLLNQLSLIYGGITNTIPSFYVGIEKGLTTFFTTALTTMDRISMVFPLIITVLGVIAIIYAFKNVDFFRFKMADIRRKISNKFSSK